LPVKEKVKTPLKWVTEIIHKFYRNKYIFTEKKYRKLVLALQMSALKVIS
jgi:hypothetical protein